MKSENRFLGKHCLMGILGVVLILCFASCSSQSNQPNPATPEGRFELAQREFSAARFDKALDYTTEILRDTPRHELAQSAMMMQMMIYGGVAEGCLQTAKAYADGRLMTRDFRIKNDFRNTAFDYYRQQKANILQFVELFDLYAKSMDKSKPVTFQAIYPQTEAGPRIALEKVRKGLPVPDEDRLKDAEIEIRNGVLTVVTALTGAGEDRAKARSLLAAGTVNVDPADFLFAAAKILHAQEALFDQMQLNELENFKSFCDRTNRTVTQSVDLYKAKGDKKKLEAAVQLKKDCEAAMKKVKRS